MGRHMPSCVPLNSGSVFIRATRRLLITVQIERKLLRYHLSVGVTCDRTKGWCLSFHGISNALLQMHERPRQRIPRYLRWIQRWKVIAASSKAACHCVHYQLTKLSEWMWQEGIKNNNNKGKEKLPQDMEWNPLWIDFPIMDKKKS